MVRRKAGDVAILWLLMAVIGIALRHCADPADHRLSLLGGLPSAAVWAMPSTR
jgi:hypothetical protein